MSISKYFIKRVINIHYQINNRSDLLIQIQLPNRFNTLLPKNILDLSLLKLYNNTMTDLVSVFIVYCNTFPKKTSLTRTDILVRTIINTYQEINQYLKYMAQFPDTIYFFRTDSYFIIPKKIEIITYYNILLK